MVAKSKTLKSQLWGNLHNTLFVKLKGSYATRTIVPGFDPFFNAITGLNGSGKSNILDLICFVLCITNLQQVRASNLQGWCTSKDMLVSRRSLSQLCLITPIGVEALSDMKISRNYRHTPDPGFVNAILPDLNEEVLTNHDQLMEVFRSFDKDGHGGRGQISREI
ncbi:hypothetical protein L2E82_14509 [Cichorium intybus]|uniref:Uncharacterized protein n=1 Tax=Cichorium intybus TaxID=13427 RepID=A0ACB9F0M5_CICIN|nr:hypothetical protein L2E82_14509 [Cichorium intybus]